MALQNRLTDLEQQRNNGIIDEGRFALLAGHLDQQRIAILMELQQATAGKDPAFDSVVNSALEKAPDEQVGAGLAKVADEKGLGTEIKEGIKEHRGAIISTIIDVGLGLLGKAAGAG